MSGDKICPQCNRGELGFSGDGTAVVCELCGYRRVTAWSPPSLADLKELATYGGIQVSTDDVRERGNYILLAEAMDAIKAGKWLDGYVHLSQLLRRRTDSRTKAEAWFGLSQLVTEEASQRYCLEQALALEPTLAKGRQALAVLDGRLQAADIINPDQLQRPTNPEPLPVRAEQFFCPRCDSRMNYSADGRRLLCEFCHYQELLEPDAEADDGTAVEAQFGQGEFEQEFSTALATARGHLQPTQIRTFSCNRCAVEFILSPHSISLTCPYCNSVYVTEAAESTDLVPPHALVPFLLSADDALQRLRRWFRQEKIERPRLLPLVGLYLPAWTFDIGGEIRWNALAQQGNMWVPISGNRLPYYDDVLVLADKTLPAKWRPQLQTVDPAQLVAYDAAYLADWPAERYQISLADASIQARKRVLADIRQKQEQLLSAETVRELRINSAGLVIESFKQILLPIWMSHYRVEEGEYELLVRGDTGQLLGERPSRGVGKLLSWLFDKK